MKALLPDLTENDSTVLLRSSVDFYSSSNKLAIDISDENVNKTRYFNKMKALAFHGVNYLLFFKNETLKKEIFNSYISDRLSSNVSYTGHSIKKISELVYRQFSRSNSFRSLGRPSINYGLYIKEELYATMSFRKSKTGYELVNFVKKNGESPEQFFGLLLQHFIDTYDPKNIIHFVDRRLDRYDYFIKLGFYVGGFGNPRWYLVDDMTVKRNTNKYIGDKVWDCGTIKLIWKSSVQ